MLGVVRLHSDAEYQNGEYAVLVRSDLKSRGLGWLLMQLIVEYARSEGLRTVSGQVLRENATMMQMCRELGFQIESDPQEPSAMLVRYAL
jgi:acetyltransferase